MNMNGGTQSGQGYEQQSFPQAQAPPPAPNYAPQLAVAPAGQWSTGLYDCSDDPSNCMMTWCCPASTFGKNAEIIDKGATSRACASLTFRCYGIIGAQFLYTYGYRTKLRSLYSLPEDPCSDCCVHSWCFFCALCQESRELKIRGFDPSLGWKANVEKMKHGQTTEPPTVAPGMAR